MDPRSPQPRIRLSAKKIGIAALASLAAVSLTGCAGMMNALEKVHEESFENVRSAESGWEGVDYPAWIPEDGTGIRNRATNDESQAVVFVTTDTDPAGCTEAERRGIPFDDPEWAPELDPLPDTVWSCGDYEVTRAGDGLLGWFTAVEAGDKPGS